jgi:hypothetical protein
MFTITGNKFRLVPDKYKLSKSSTSANITNGQHNGTISATESYQD